MGRQAGASVRASAWSAALVGGPLALWSAMHGSAMAGSGWTAPRSNRRPFGRLWARSLGPDGDAVVLLHGLISTGDVFGAAYEQLASTHRLLVPDLLGFGRSMDEQRSSFGVDAHLDALDELAERSGLFNSSRWTLGAHSMGVSLALRWAIRHPDRVVRVVGWGAPTYPTPERARRHVAGSAMARLFALDTPMAARACALSCRHRTVAGWLSAVVEPQLPVAVARQAPLHTWPAYRDAIRYLVIDVDWEELVTTCARLRVDIRFVWGERDAVGDRVYAEQLTSGRAGRVDVLDHGDHRLPLTNPAMCISHLTDGLG
jgi:pimeloyl-ACP methyl ester carboxylesterase